MAKQPPPPTDTWSLMEDIAFAERLMQFPAMTVMVFLRPDLGYRFVSPLRLFIVNGVVAVVAILNQPHDTDADTGPNDLLIFALLSLTAGMIQRFLRGRDLDRGFTQHSYYIGTSPFALSWLPGFLLRKRRMARFADPLLCMLAGLIALQFSHALGFWLILAGLCLRGTEFSVAREARKLNLDLMDGLIASETQAQAVEHYEAPASPQAGQPTTGIPTGLGADLRPHVEQAAPQAAPVIESGPASKLTKWRIRLAYAAAASADALHLFMAPGSHMAWLAMPTEIAEFIIDCAAMGATMLLLGFHWALLPSFFIELIPSANIVPTWTGCVALVVWQKKKELAQTPPEPIQVAGMPVADNDAERRLRHLADLQQKGLISQAEYDAKRRQILGSL